MKIVKIIGPLLCLIYICSNCAKEEVEAEIPFIIGDTSDNFTLVTFNPAIEVGYSGEDSYSLDIDGDGNSDFELYRTGGLFGSVWINVEVFMKILNPEIEFSAVDSLNQRFYPIIYDKGDTLYYSDKYICWSHAKIYFTHWYNNYLKYLWFRNRINESYLYGWFQFSADGNEDYISISLHGYAIQKKEPLN